MHFSIGLLIFSLPFSRSYGNVVMDRVDWKKKKREKKKNASRREKGRWMPRRRYKSDTYMKRSCTGHFWRVLSIIGDQPAIIASRGFLSASRTKRQRRRWSSVLSRAQMTRGSTNGCAASNGFKWKPGSRISKGSRSFRIARFSKFFIRSPERRIKRAFSNEMRLLDRNE